MFCILVALKASFRLKGNDFCFILCKEYKLRK